MTQQTQVPGTIDPFETPLETPAGNPAWHDEPMSEEEIAREQAALAEIAKLREALDAATEVQERAREALAEGIVKHLKARTTTPGKVADASKYDRNHVRRIADAGGVPPLRPSTVRSVKPRRRPKS